MAAVASGQVSQREAEVLALLGERLSNAQIAGRLHISVRTVENHVASLLRKCRVSDRHALAAIAAQATGQPGPAVVGLPAPRTAFIGRAHERDAVLGMLDGARLITLVGPGGVGKTRLAAVIARTVSQNRSLGGAFVDLVPVRGSLVSQAVAAVLDVPERPEEPLHDAITARLGGGRQLLILDHCEPVLEAVADFADRVLAACPGTTIMATSRERLGLPGEQVVPVYPLPLASDAEALFTDRARAADPQFTADAAVVARICSRLDGMPLAIELAAVRCPSLGAHGLLGVLDDTLRLISDGRNPDRRHRSLRAVIGWSYDLLSDDQQALFRRLAVFRGSFDIHAAAALSPGGSPGAVADVLGRLVDKSLVVHERAAGRWRLLDTVRAFAVEQLNGSADHEEVESRYLQWAAAAAEALRARLAERWRPDFDAVADDLRAALACCPPGPGTLPHRLARSLGHLCYARRFLTAALGHFEEAARRAPSPAQAAADLRTAAQSVFAIGLAWRAFDLLQASAEEYQAAGDRDTRAVALADAVVTARRFPSGFPEPVPMDKLRSLLDQAAAAGRAGRPAVEARLAAAAAWMTSQPPDPRRAEAAVAAARATGDPVLIGGGLDALTTVHIRSGRYRRAHELARERLALLDAVNRHDPYAAAEILDAYHGAWLTALAAGDLPAALSIARMIAQDELLGAHPYRPASKLIPPLVLAGRFDETLRHADSMWDGWQRSGAPIAAWVAPAASAVALAHGLLGDDSGYQLWRSRANQAQGPAHRAYGRNSSSFVAFTDIRLAVHTGEVSDPTALIDRALAQSAGGWLEAYVRAAAAELAVLVGLPDADAYLTAAAGTENDWAMACLARAEGRLLGDTRALAESARRWQHIDARFERHCTLQLLEASPRVSGGSGEQ
jgi:predicted ATPase/DNA-binding CsgD family transcriptional regulator